MTARFERLWFPYTEWEDYKNGMWRTVTGSERIALLKKAITFTGDAKLYGSFMRRVIKEWPIGCLHFLGDRQSNRKAWVGHSAACLAISSPEDVTRQAWCYLNEQQQNEANHEAELSIQEWELNYEAKDFELYRKMGGTGLLSRNTRRSTLEIRGSKQSPELPENMQSNFK